MKDSVSIATRSKPGGVKLTKMDFILGNHDLHFQLKSIEKEAFRGARTYRSLDSVKQKMRPEVMQYDPANVGD
jgi:hypothetical protein